MLAKCILNGLARIVGEKRPQWVEVGQVHDVELNEGDVLPQNFVVFEEPVVESETTESKGSKSNKKKDAKSANMSEENL